MLEPGGSYDEVYRNFRWEIPEHYNIGVDICDKHADGDGVALIYEDEDGGITRYSFRDLKRLSNQCANALAALGVGRGDRVGILLPQSPELGISHIAAYKMGAIALPLFTLFGPEGLAYRLGNSETKAVVTDTGNLEKLEQIRDALPALKHVLVVDVPPGRPAPEGTESYWALLDKASDRFAPVQTKADDPVLIMYTSGTTGPPKGALQAHRTLLGHLPGVEFPGNFFPQPGDLFWTPADWAWAGGLLDVLLPSWHHGVPVVGHRFKKFDPERAFDLMARHGVRNTFLPPTALKLMRQVPNARERYDFRLRSVSCAGEPVGAELVDWAKDGLGLTINEFYGQTEINLVLANCADLHEVRSGSMGLPVPGHVVEIVDDEGNPLPAGETGNVAVRRPDPVMFLGYWQNPDATEKKFVGDWGLMGDLGRKDEDGYFWFLGRDDDVITSGAYRIGPGEIEDCLIKHPAVALAAVIGVPDPVRTEAVKAFIVPKQGITPDSSLMTEIQDFVKTRLAAHEYPRLIEFVDELPMTATGKIRRKDLRERELAKQEDDPTA
ncbi:MAG: acyl-CoA synthetase [Alphaproteobacteria bacterium]|nr:acyl-CoA synthetase [Alphaproteobacteria bacterium]